MIQANRDKDKAGNLTIKELGSLLGVSITLLTMPTTFTQASHLWRIVRPQDV